ncbi:MAG: geranylgeranyl reductase family protein [Anaerolineae bacterium]|nr:geranylgeranyl reductase family protein [Anaerolineae bacterium]
MIYDAIVIGSGPGGAVAAATLAQQGKSVLLADRQAFPRDKVCGDGLPIHVMLMLHEMGIDVRKAGIDYHRVTSLSIEAPSGRTLTTHEVSEDVFSMTATRMSFDLALHRKAIENGAKFEMMNITKPLMDGNRVVGVVERRDKTLIEHEAKVVIAADGASSALARTVRGRVQDADKTAVSIRAYGVLKKPMPPCVYFYFPRDLIPGYAWIFPSANGRCNIGVYLHNREYKARTEGLETLLKQFSERMQAEFPHEILSETAQTWQLPLFTDKQVRHVPGMMFVGDAGQFVNAITGGGIYPAMLTGRAAAQTALEVLDGTATEAAYEPRWQQAVGGSLGTAWLIKQYVASNAAVFNGIFWLATLPVLRAPVLRAMSGEHY